VVDEGPNVRLSESPFRTMVSLRVDPRPSVASDLEAVLGVTLPHTCGQVAHGGVHDVIWMGPDEWLVVSWMDGPALVFALCDAVEGGHAAVVDVSANRTTLHLSGSAARSVLEKGCPVDLHPRSFPADTAVLTTLARIPVLLWHAEPDTYRLMPRSSFADYVARWLRDAMQEFQTSGLQ
jgi:sarcosine oxidase subunit gamma